MKISVWFHAVLSGPRISHPDYAISLLQSQMNALTVAGIPITELHIGVNGSDHDSLTAASLVPEKAIVHVNGPSAQCELATLKRLRESLEPGWFVLYHHMKGVQYPGNPAWDRWRNCMQNVCVNHWQECVDELDRGCDTVGAHWMTQKRYAMIPKGQRYWGGNFFWATSDYLMTLPRLAEDTWENRYEAEVWIGKSKYDPEIHDFARHFPMKGCP